MEPAQEDAWQQKQLQWLNRQALEHNVRQRELTCHGERLRQLIDHVHGALRELFEHVASVGEQEHEYHREE